MKLFKTRYAPLFLCLGLYLFVSTLLRIYVEYRFGAVGLWNRECLEAFFIGFRMDMASGFLLFVPLAFWLTFVSDKVFESRFHKYALLTLFTLFAIAQIFLFKVEAEFFEEFNARFNTVAVDYLIYPHEVFQNIWESYPVALVVSISIALGCGIAFLSRKRILKSGEAFMPLRQRYACLAVYLSLCVVFDATVSYATTRFSQDRVMNEISSNGLYSFIYAAWSRDLDYRSYYSTIPMDEAYARTRKMLAQPGAKFNPANDSIERMIPGHPGKRPTNLVVILVESFGAEFWGSLNDSQTTYTPEMDALSKDGMLFTNLYASGNRTVRGMEGVLASFPPLPGDSIVKRHLSKNVATLARLFKQQNYETVFLYGGRGVFDGMRAFNTRNGYDRFIEQKDFRSPTFSTVWGVCDEDLMHRTVDELRALHDRKKPFFATVLTVSNHKPYTYPPGRIPEDPNQRRRTNAVKYTDWALGDFFRLVKKEAFYKDTVFAVVADHGARVYGSQTMPITSYRIPLVVVGPNVRAGSRNNTMGSSLDVGPTLIGLMGFPYKSVFFGRDLNALLPATSWVPMNHNRDVSLYQDGKLVVLGLNKTVEYDEIRGNELARSSAPWTRFQETERNAIALYQVADDLYRHEKYRNE